MLMFASMDPYFVTRHGPSSRTILGGMPHLMKSDLPILPGNRKLPTTEIRHFLGAVEGSASSSSKPCIACHSLLSNDWTPFGDDEHLCTKCSNYRTAGGDPFDFKCMSCGERPKEIGNAGRISSTPFSSSTVMNNDGSSFGLALAHEIEFFPPTGTWVRRRERATSKSNGDKLAGKRKTLTGIKFDANTRCESCGMGVEGRDPKRLFQYQAELKMILFIREFAYYKNHRVLLGDYRLKPPSNRPEEDKLVCESCGLRDVPGKKKQVK